MTVPTPTSSGEESEPGERSVQPTFVGEYRHSIDAKGRLIVPSRLRTALAGDEVVLARWAEGCIAMWSPTGWEEIATSLRAQGNSNPNARAVMRVLAASAHWDTVDKQGRISVPEKLRERAGIDKEVVVVGAFNKAELWAPDRWEERVAEAEDGKFEEMVSQLDF